MITTYNFKKIDNNNHLKYRVEYTPNSFTFMEDLYFTTIFTNYEDGSHTKAKIYPDGVDVYGSDIYAMLKMGIKVDLIVNGEYILKLTEIGNSYARFSNGGLTLSVDPDGNVTEISTNTGE